MRAYSFAPRLKHGRCQAHVGKGRCGSRKGEGSRREARHSCGMRAQGDTMPEGGICVPLGSSVRFGMRHG